MYVLSKFLKFCPSQAHRSYIQSIEKTLLCENYKPLTMRPNRFMSTYILSFTHSDKTLFFVLYVAMETVQTKQKVTNNAQFERFTVQILPKFSPLYEYELCRAQLILHRFDCYVQLASVTSRNVLFFECANDNIHLPINLLGLIVNGF